MSSMRIASVPSRLRSKLGCSVTEEARTCEDWSQSGVEESRRPKSAIGRQAPFSQSPYSSGRYPCASHLGSGGKSLASSVELNSLPKLTFHPLLPLPSKAPREYARSRSDASRESRIST